MPKPYDGEGGVLLSYVALPYLSKHSHHAMMGCNLAFCNKGGGELLYLL
jgi:hypothetical protein